MVQGTKNNEERIDELLAFVENALRSRSMVSLVIIATEINNDPNMALATEIRCTFSADMNAQAQKEAFILSLDKAYETMPNFE